MSKYVRNNLTGVLAPVNAELEKIENNLAEKLDRIPEAGQANQLTEDLDANGQRILNVAAPSEPSDLVRLKDLENLGGNASGAILPPQAGQDNEWLRTDGEDAFWDIVTKEDVGLDEVDNTSDADKPVSTATQTALDRKPEVFATVAAMQATNPTDTGIVAICQENDNGRYALADVSYIATTGDITAANGRVWQLQDRDKVEYFDDIYDAVSDTGATISGVYEQTDTTTVAMNGDSLADFDYTLNVADGTTTLGFTPFANGAYFTSSYFAGGTTESGGTRNRTAHMINLSGTSVSGVTLKDSEITGWTFPLLKSNATTGTQTRFVFSGNYFHDNYGIDALFNSPATGSLIDNIIVSGNVFGDNLAEDIGGFSHRCSMAGHVENFVFNGNIAYGQGNEIWRAEEAAKNGIVACNAAQLGDRHGIEVTDNNVGGVAYTPSQLVITSNALEGQGTAGTRGLHFTFDGSGVHPIEKSICGGNVLSNWDAGIRLARKASLNDNTGNVVNDCAVGVLSQEPTLTTNNTTLIDVTTKFDADSGGLFGTVNLRDTSSESPLFTGMVAAAGNPAGVTGWTYESGLFSTINAANTYIPVIELGDGFNLDIVIYFGREAGNYSFVRGVLDWDGATLTFTENHRTQAGSLVLSGGAPFRDNAGNLEVNIFAGTPAVYTNCRIQIEAKGVHIFS